VILWILQLLTFGRSNHHRRTAPWNKPLYLVYLSSAWALQAWSILRLLHGTPLFNIVARVLGTTFHGKALFFGNRIYDFPFLVDIADKTVIDNCWVNGHFVVFQDIQLGPCHVSGVLHPYCFAMANARVTQAETGPFRAIMNKGAKDERQVAKEVGLKVELGNTTRTLDKELEYELDYRDIEGDCSLIPSI
jgi:hypothetical protein